MSSIYVQVTAIKRVERAGVLTTYYPGDWVEVNRGVAKRWLAAGDAVIFNMAETDLLPRHAGAVINRNNKNALQALQQVGVAYQTSRSRLQLPYEFTLLWDVAFDLAQPGLIVTGLALLERWEVLAPFYGYDVLASTCGDAESRERTQCLVHDLRVPVYNPRLLFVRDCQRTRQLLRVWQDEGGDNDLSFLRAVYRVKPLINPLPSEWERK